MTNECTFHRGFSSFFGGLLLLLLLAFLGFGTLGGGGLLRPFFVALGLAPGQKFMRESKINLNVID